MKKPLLFGGPFFTSNGNHLFQDQMDITKEREYFLEKRPSTLNYLLENRYKWMNSYISSDDKGIEIGCGTGLSKLFIKSENFRLTDFIKNTWVDEVADALNLPFEDSSLDYIIASNVIHHLAKPSRFFKECSRVLRDGGRIIIQEAYLSLMLRVLSRITANEGYSYNYNVFDENINLNAGDDPWDANVAIPTMLFAEADKFEQHFNFKVSKIKYSECLLWPLSGGIAPVSFRINLPRSILRLVEIIDKVLVKVSKDIFALQMQVVLQKY